MNIGIYARVLRNKAAIDCLQNLVNYLAKNGHGVFFHDNLHKSLAESKVSIEEKYDVFSTGEILQSRIDYLLCIGGDGTMLDTLTIVRETGIPVLGFNTGRLGYLATSNPNDVAKVVDELSKKSYHIDKRTILKLEADQELFGGFAYALERFCNSQNRQYQHDYRTYLLKRRVYEYLLGGWINCCDPNRIFSLFLKLWRTNSNSTIGEFCNNTDSAS
jgi:NAD kinase